MNHLANHQNTRRSRISAGLLMYRLRSGLLEVFIAHPGGPWFPNRDNDVWTIPKGEIEPGEEPIQAAMREFMEEVGIEPKGPYIELGAIKQRGGKTVHAWAFEGDWEETEGIRSNEVEVEWPPGSGRWSRWPEIDRAAFFRLTDARQRMKMAQHPLLDRLAKVLHADMEGRFHNLPLGVEGIK
ncbi:MAG TPA: NUDIX domain-containing protein [Candidatus Limnocylindria bacterium]|jgi:predicted NUDIX family NTP pyrophosphohydrolase|nr:NUDIX domain-containing protein [Candidatus Limnocylindria bacterium]